MSDGCYRSDNEVEEEPRRVTVYAHTIDSLKSRIQTLEAANARLREENQRLAANLLNPGQAETKTHDCRALIAAEIDRLQRCLQK